MLADGEKEHESIVPGLTDMNRFGQPHCDGDALAPPITSGVQHLWRANRGRALRIHRLPRVWPHHRKSASSNRAVLIFNACANQRIPAADANAVGVVVAGLDRVAEAQRFRASSVEVHGVA